MIAGSIRILGFVLAACPLWAAVPEAVAEAARGAAFARDGKYELVNQHYKAALRLDSAVPGLQLNLGLAYFKSNHLREAAAAFEEAVRADSGSFQARALLGMSYYGSSRYRDAAAQLKLASEAQPDNLELRYTLAQSYLLSDQYPEALAEFQFLLSMNPDSAPVHILLGQVLDASNREDAATAEFEAAVKASTVPPDAHFGLGYLYWKQRRDVEARREFEVELTSQPQHAQVLTYLGDAEMQEDLQKPAETHLRRALALDANIPLAHLDLGILLAGRNHADEAAQHLREAIRLDPG
jgi:tetratricopeptide (TPR) repeat protein